MSRASKPPRLARALLEHFVPEGATREGLLGDLSEMYAERRRAGERVRAVLWYWKEAILASSSYWWFSRRSPSAAKRRRGRVIPIARELRAALRQLVAAPSFTAPAVVTLSIGLGATAAIFAVVYSVVLEPLPFPEPERLVVIEHELPGFAMPSEETARFAGLQAQVLQYSEHSRELTSVGAFAAFDGAITERTNPQSVRIASASAGFFEALGVAPLLGRLFEPEEPTPQTTERGSSLLSDPLWRQRYGAQHDVLGRTLEAEGFDFEVIGVLPPLPAFPPDPVRLWNAMPVSRLRDHPQWTVDGIVGRLAAGATPESAARELDALIQELPDRFDDLQVRRAVSDGHMRAVVTPMKDWLVADVASTLWLLFAAVGVLWLAASVNVVNLVLVRSESRRVESAIRAALGRTRLQWLHQSVAEALLVVVPAALLGATIASIGTEALVAFGPRSLPRLTSVRLSGAALLFLIGLSAASVVLCALAPLIHEAARTVSLRDIGRGVSSSRRSLRLRHGLAASELALALVLLVGSGLIARSFWALSRVDVGFSAAGVLTFRVPFPFQEIQDEAPTELRATTFYDRLAERLASLPGVSSVGYGHCVPLSRDCDLSGFTLLPAEWPDDTGERPVTGLAQISPGYLETLGIPLLSGRSLEARDHTSRSNAVLVNREAARRLWPGVRSPLGERLVLAGNPDWGELEVVGIVGDVQHDELRNAAEPVVYAPPLLAAQRYELFTVSYVVRVASGNPLDLAASIRREVSALRPDIPVFGLDVMDQVVRRATADVRFTMVLIALAATTTLLLAAVGVYGVLAYVVALRRNEFGLRLALGARSADVRTLVLRQASSVYLIGILVGIPLSVGLARTIESLLFQIQPADPLTYALALPLLLVVVLTAVALPARRAAAVDPATVLQGD